MIPLSEGRRRNHGLCISLRALLFAALFVVPFWTLVVYLVVTNA